MYKKVISILFCIIIFIGGADILLTNRGNIKLTIVSFISDLNVDRFFETLDKNFNFNNDIDKKLQKIYDGTQIIMCKKEIGNFTYYKNEETDGLVLITNNDSKKGIKENTEKINKLYEEFKKRNIDFLYVSMPEEVKGKLKEKLNDIDYGNEITDMVLEELNNVPYIDLRDNKKIKKMSENYYKTDHHWNLETCFEAFCSVINEINNLYNLNLDKDNKYTNLENYNIKIKEDCFFGSKGVNTGTFFIKKEEFSLFLPKYETDFEYRHYNTKGKMKVSTKGEFEEALIDNSKLNLDTYVNKYNCFLYGGNCENVIINKKSENNKKLLLISSSYGRAFAPYISQCFYETRYIDPQQGRFEQNVINYIDNYKPDIVVMLYKGTTNIDFI